MKETLSMLIYEPPEWDLQRILSVAIALVLLILILVFYHRHIKHQEEAESRGIDLGTVYGHKDDAEEMIDIKEQDA